MTVGAAVPWGSSDPLEVYLTEGTVRAKPGAGKLALPWERVWTWSAEEVALHHWLLLPASMTLNMRGWWASGGVTTVGYAGPSWLCSSSRWLDEPPDTRSGVLERAELAAEQGAEIEACCRGLGIKGKGSPGSAARALLDQLCRKVRGKVRPPWPRPEEGMLDFGQLAIVGGRNEAWRTGWTVGPVSQWDRRSAYLSHLTQPLPVPGTERWLEGLSWRKRLERHGITACYVEIPAELEVPPLAVRAKEGSEWRTVWPVGRACGAWTHEELRTAVERGVRILGCGATLTFDMGVGPIGRLGRRVWEQRAAGRLAKRVGTALVGKLHQGKRKREVIPLPWLEAGRHLEARRAAHYPDTTIVIPRQRADAVDLALVPRDADAYAWHALPHVAAHVLARARLELLQVLEENRDRVLACATDSVTLIGHEPPRGGVVGEGLGEWREELLGTACEIAGPMSYRIYGERGQLKARAAGVARSQAAAWLAGDRLRQEGRALLSARFLPGGWVGRGLHRQGAGGLPATGRHAELAGRTGTVRVDCQDSGRVVVDIEEGRTRVIG